MGRTDPGPRRQQMLNLLEETGTLDVGELADRFGVSVVTIRKDLDELGAEGLLERTFGGAVFSHRSRFNRAFLQRALEHRQEKRAIGQKQKPGFTWAGNAENHRALSGGQGISWKHRIHRRDGPQHAQS